VVDDPLFTGRYPGQWGCLAIFTMKNGDVVEKRIDDMSGSVRLPLTKKQEENKFVSLAGFAREDSGKIRRFLEDILRIDSLTCLPDLS